MNVAVVVAVVTDDTGVYAIVGLIWAYVVMYL